jgi:hypothetical protein
MSTDAGSIAKKFVMTLLCAKLSFRYIAMLCAHDGPRFSTVLCFHARSFAKKSLSLYYINNVLTFVMLPETTISVSRCRSVSMNFIICRTSIHGSKYEREKITGILQ